MKKSACFLFSSFLFFSFPCSNSYSQYEYQYRPTQRFISRSVRGNKYVAPDMINVRVFLGSAIENLFHNQGFTTYDYLLMNLQGGAPLPGVPNPYYKNREIGFRMQRAIILPEPMPTPKNSYRYSAGGYDPFRFDPSLIPPHLLASATQPLDATEEDLTVQLPPAQAFPENFDRLPVLQPPSAEIPSATDQPPLQQPVNQSALTRAYPNRSPIPLVRYPKFSRMEILYQRGLSAFETRNYIKAKQIFSEMVQLHPDSAHVHFGLGLSLFYAGEYETALDELGRGYRIAKLNGSPEPTVWEMKINPQDFRYYHRKLLGVVNRNPENKTNGTLLFLLSHAGAMPRE